MDREALKSLASARRNQAEALPEPKARKIVWKCEHCEHDFASERVFMNHRCRERERHDELRSPTGQAAYAFYSEWMRLNRRSVPPIETFAHSTYYTTFIKFARHVTKVNMPTPLAFVRAMVDNGNVQPSLWCKDNVYALYLSGYDKVVDPADQFARSSELAHQLAKDYDVPRGNLFDAMGVEKILDFVQKRKFSPWFLVSSKAFRSFMARQDVLNKDALEGAVQVGAMIMRIQHEPKSAEHFRLFTEVNVAEGF